MLMNKKEENVQKKLIETAHKNYAKNLNKYSFFKLHNKVLSEDTVQDTFIKTWKYMVRGGKIVMMKSFLYHILNDLIIDEYRKNKPTSLNALMDNGFDFGFNDFDKQIDKLDGEKAMKMMKKLPVKYRKILKMKYTQDLSLSEMAEITGQTKNTLAVQIHRGIEKLKVEYNRT
jgi:RNA polymerase sigma-70 factor (ECF subfamily)